MFDYNFSSHFGDASFNDDFKDVLFTVFAMKQQERKRNEAWVQTKPNQRSKQVQERIKLLKEQAEDIEYEEVHC